MADFLFGKISEALKAGKKASESIYHGPVSGTSLDVLNLDFSDFISNRDLFLSVEDQDDFVWGQRWGNKTSKVAK